MRRLGQPAKKISAGSDPGLWPGGSFCSIWYHIERVDELACWRRQVDSKPKSMERDSAIVATHRI